MVQDWFRDARLGIFIHWGIYSKGATSESWDMFNGLISQAEYNAQASDFTAARFDAGEWADLFASAGARYAVLTTKHHDGFALWPSAHSCWNAASASPAGRDLVGPYVQALRQRGLHVGLYYSLSDWAHPDYASVQPDAPAALAAHEAMRQNPLAYRQGAQDPEAWQRFVHFQRGQLEELCTVYRPDLLWFDGDWERSDAQWGFDSMVLSMQRWAPGVVFNGRLGNWGDYSTPEQALPVLAPEGPWEFCATMNDSWGYRTHDKNYKSGRQCIELLVECAGMGGNLLLDVAPRADGSIPDEQVQRLRQIGRWLAKHGEAIYATRAGLPHGHFWGPSTLSKDTRTVYLFCPNGASPQVSVRGLMNRVLQACVVGHPNVALASRCLGGAPWADLPGILWVDVPPALCDADVTVVKLELDGPLRLYRGSGDKIIHNVHTET